MIALRPLTLGDIFNGAFSYIRANPKATLGLAVIIMAIAAILPTLGFSSVSQSYADWIDQATAPTSQPSELGPVPFSTFGLISLFGGALIELVARLVLSGLLAMVCGLAVVGRHLSLGEAVQAVRPRIGAILGLGGVMFLLSVAWILALVALFFVVATLGFLLEGAGAVLGVLLTLAGLAVMVVLGAWIYVKLALAMPIVVLERLGPFQALGRSWRLTANSFWRVFGILLLAQILVTIVANILSIPFSIVPSLAALGMSDSAWLVVLESASIFVGSVLAGAVTGPFVAGVTALLYVDLRMRREGLDLKLQTATQSGRHVDADIYLPDPAPGGMAAPGGGAG
ncbi:glycerophosphoryl diester phosphodiesterase membrane domain-containing protein [Salinactinospora qingdaonensis]|uniref:glycerophosphoryl diester phosphodiesterase membrane domain-containing protein n=1 Tax=Salinactinospora qingdaonensis TaxID=702744 RepID=UPI0031E7E9AA